MRKRRTVSFLAGVVTAGLLVASCAGAGGDDTGAAGGRLTIATTVAPITSIVGGVVGDRAEVVGIVPEGTDSHTFEPRPSVAELLSEADVLYMNGLGLEEPTRALAEQNMHPGAEIVELGPRTIPPERYVYDFSFPEEEGRPNPHLWTDPTLARRYAQIVTEDMSRRDPDGADAYAANYERFSALVDELDRAMRASFATIPRRELLTYHDAYAYFAQAYDWEVIGAIQVSDFEDPTPGEVADLIDQIEARDVPAIFGSEVFPSPVLGQIGRETGVRYVDELRDDDLPGEPGDPEHSWLGLMRSNFVTLTRALGGDPSTLEALELPTATPDAARYPQ